MSEVLVKVENVSKRFCRSLKRSLWYGLQDLGSEIGGRRHGGGIGLPQSSVDVQLRTDEFWAVKDVSFELRRGECLGLIGGNGAGKTTLLRMLNGLIKPDTGRVEMKGEIGALIALGAGFNPILTGRENIRVNTSVLGLSRKDCEDKIDEIIDFSEIDQFIDTPVQSYSSGMQVRLGFAIAAVLKPDILILDEVLAVGDARFRAKCYKAIHERLISSATLFVSHDREAISRTCTSSLYLIKGVTRHVGNVQEGLSIYLSESHGQAGDSNSEIVCDGLNANLLNTENDKTIRAAWSDEVDIRIELDAVREISNAIISLEIKDLNGTIVGEITSLNSLGSFVQLPTGKHIVSFQTSSLPLKNGNYILTLLVIESPLRHVHWNPNFARLVVTCIQKLSGHQTTLIPATCNISKAYASGSLLNKYTS